MLILGAASKNLVESDFLRLGMKGKHVEGWVGGIVKVIQARNPDTLDPKGHYFILFDTHEAAVAYKDRLEQLWELGKTYVPGAHHGRWHTLQLPLPRGLRQTETGEDVAALIRSFTLVAPSQRLQVQLSRASPSRIAELYLEGGFARQLAARAGSASHALVLVRLDGGRLTVSTLRRAIEDDGQRRNLAWRVADLENGILPFGKSILKAKDRAWADRITKRSFADEFSAQDFDDEDGEHEYNKDGSVGPGGGVDNTIYKAEESSDHAEEIRDKRRQYHRFIIPFTDKEEAYRFVQNWHRRELKLHMGGGTKKHPSWGETRIVNTTVLW
ncbi:hypothetical protein F4859DRAFT_486162 [Xylaria cf. heliscus]|nr:hypothetical protein F4859DRAFT_486162 [Xylaria cf. heliscus]